MSDVSQGQAFIGLRQQQFANLFTYKKSGELVKTPVWFAQVGDRLYIVTGATSGKVKRIRNNPRVQIGPGDRAGKPLGATVPALARVLPATDAAAAKAALDSKYGLMKAVFDFVGTLRGFDRAYLEIKPER